MTQPANPSAGDRALLQSEDRFRLLVEGVTDYAIFMLDVDGRVITWNAGAERIKGYRSDEIIGQHFSTFYPASSRELPARELEVAAAEGRYEDEGWRLRKDGSMFWASVVITALHDRSGRLSGFAKITRDLTRRRKQEEESFAKARNVSVYWSKVSPTAPFLCSTPMATS